MPRSSLQGRGLADIAGESALVAGGGRAILLQLANPAVGRGVAEHSDFYNRPLDRLAATLTYIYAVAYGTDEEIAFVRDRVDHAHAPVHDDGTASTPYNAFDPELQLWVAATLYETAITLYERIFGTLDDDASERIYREYAALGTSLQMPLELWPADRTAFAAYWEDQLGRLVVDDAIRGVADRLLNPATLPLQMRPIMPTARLVTAGLLGDDLRRQFRLPWDTRRQRRYDRVLGTAATVVPRLPRRVRHILRDHYLNDLRKQMERRQPQPT